jgi:hypothetical protein
MFHSKNIIKALQAQSRKVLVIDVAGNLENIENIDYIDFQKKNLRLTSTDIENLIREKMTK